MTRRPRAVSLISGGLDSLLATKTVLDQGVHVEGITFYTGFCVEGHTHAIRDKDRSRPKRNNALWVAEQLGIKLHLIDVVEDYKNVVLHPRHGYGAHLNPCLDCKVFMLTRARHWIEEHDFDFVITGEVVGQRPKSQLRHKLPLVQEQSGLGDRLVRPLSAKKLTPTLPEREGWLARERLHAFAGRRRKPQLALARAYGFEEFAQPAGGCCFLTDAAYAVKLRDLWQARGARRYELDDITLLKVGRHIRPAPHLKLIVAREEGEARFLRGYRTRYPSLATVSHGGPLALLDGAPNEAELELAARIVARYSQGRNESRVDLAYRCTDGSKRSLSVIPLPADDLPREWIL